MLTPRRARVHLVALPHTQVTREYDYCAYTAKLRRFTTMLAFSEHTPLLYGPEQCDVAPVTELYPVVDAEDRQLWFGMDQWDRNRVFNGWDATGEHWRTMNQRAAALIANNWQAGDLLGLIAGQCQMQVAAELHTRGIKPLIWEWGIGYSGVVPGSHRTYESYAWAHHVAGLQAGRTEADSEAVAGGTDEMHYFDSVIPNCYDSADFAPSFEPGEYLLFMGRPTPRKGLPIVAEIAARAGLPVKVAGQPGADIPGAEYVGLVTGQAKAELLAGARAVLTPTSYLEPFGGVAVEAMLSGTPVIASDWGAFTETVVPHVTGFRCRTLAEFLTAVKLVEHIDRRGVHREAIGKYTLTHGARLYDQHIQKLLTLYGEGWYAL